MCGISAIFGKELTPESLQAIYSMTTSIRHRGPDDEGFAFFSKEAHTPPIITGGPDTPAEVYASGFPYSPRSPRLVSGEFLGAMGHRRLSILDLSPAGHQPMCTLDQRYWIVYNGEIYNYIELREDLKKEGYAFCTNTDTEVILKAFEAYGLDCFSFFNGMFAIVIYDAFKRKVYAARDRFGVKPLYFYQHGRSIAFASEIKQFTFLPNWEANLNGQRAYDFLNWGFSNHTDETLFSGVKQLRGGEYGILDLNGDSSFQMAIKQWYIPSLTKFTGSFDEAAKTYQYLLADAIRLRLRADVPVGSCLSGGLDSSSIVCLTKDLLQGSTSSEKQLTFSACSAEKRFDERYYIDQVVEATGVEAHYTYPQFGQLFEDSKAIAWHQDEPFRSTSIYAQWLVFRLAKEKNVKVMLDGQGADEQLGGYLGFFGNRFYDLFRTFRWARLMDEIASAKENHVLLNPVAMLMNKLVPNIVRQPIRKLLGKSAKNPGWLNIEKLQAEFVDPFVAHRQHTLLDQSVHQLKYSSLPMLLHYEDRDSMAHSIESRTPFLDYRLVEFTLGLPAEYKISQGWTKRVLREGMKEIIPETIRNRMDKMAFITAEEEWVKRQAPELFKKAIDNTIELAGGIIQPSIKYVINDIIAGKKPYDHMVWKLVSFGQWLECFSVKV